MRYLIRTICCLGLLLMAGCGSVTEKAENNGEACEGPAPDDGCNTCACEDGEWVCTTLGCPDTCEPGDTKDANDGCNTCTCSEDGEWLCTLAECIAVCPEPVAYEGACVAQVVYVRGNDDETCCEMPDPCSVPEGYEIFNTRKECVADANVCPAPVDSGGDCAQVITYGRTEDGLCCEYPTPCSLPAGVEAHPTLAECQTGSSTCTEGETKPAGDGCNTCTCTADGDWACTEIACDPGSCQTDEDCVVTGCSGQLCAPSPTASTCEFLPEYACYRDEITSCGCNDGTCGWAQTDELATCLGE